MPSMRARILSLGILIGLALTQLSCGGGTTTISGTTGGTGGLALFGQDAPKDNIVEFEITVTSVVLNPGSVSVLPQPVELELTGMQLNPELVRLAQNIPAGTYTSITIMVSNPEIKFCPDPPNPCNDQTIQEVQPPLTSATITINVPGGFTISANQTTGLVVDFDLAASVMVDAMGNITGINPVLTAVVVSLVGQEDLFEDVVGRVVSVNRTSSTSGTFVFEPFSTCIQVTLTVNAGTQFEDFGEANPPLADSFASLQANMIVEVDADLQADGTLLAEKVELEDEAVQDEVEGLIVSVLRDPLDQVFQFQMVPFDVAPCTATLPTSLLITVNVSPVPGAVDFRIDDDGFAINPPLAFDNPTHLEIGQKVEVDPVEALASGTTTVTAEEIKLEDQTIRGTVIATAGINFFLNPGPDLFPDQDIEVQTITGQTRFDDLPNGVADLSTGEPVRVKGLLFRTGVNELTLLAKRVDGTP